MGDLPGHPFRGNQWTNGVGVSPASVDKMSLDDNRAMMRGLVEQYRGDANFRGAADVVAAYAELSQNEGLATRAIVERALAGKTAEQIAADPKVQALLAKASPRAAVQDVKGLVAAATGYYATLRGAQPTEDVVYRGAKGSPKGDEFELRGPTAFTHSVDVAMTYAGGTLYEVVPGAKMIPVRALDNARIAAREGGETEATATVPAFYSRSSGAVHPRGPGYGFAISMDTDRELSGAGRYRVLGTSERRISYRDESSGNRRTKTVKVIRVEQVGGF